MPQEKRAPTLFKVTLPSAAQQLLQEYDRIQQLCEGLNSLYFEKTTELNQLLNIPFNIVESLRNGQFGISPYLYNIEYTFTYKIEKDGDNFLYEKDPLHIYITENVLPTLINIQYLDLRNVQLTFQLMETVTNNLQELQAIYMNTELGYSDENPNRACENILPFLIQSKKLELIHDEKHFIGIDYNCVSLLFIMLPELQSINCKYLKEILFTEDMNGIQELKLKSCYVNLDKNDDEEMTLVNVMDWIASHCPHFQRHLKFKHGVQSKMFFKTLIDNKINLTSFEIEFGSFKKNTRQLVESIEDFLLAKGDYLECFAMHFPMKPSYSNNALTYNILQILSDCCPNLRKLTLKGAYFKKDLREKAFYKKKIRLFSLEYLNFHFNDGTFELLPLLIGDCGLLKKIKCDIDQKKNADIYDFLDFFEDLCDEYEFLRLTDFNIDFYHFRHSEAKDMTPVCVGIINLCQFWPKIQRIYLKMFDELYPKEIEVVADLMKELEDKYELNIVFQHLPCKYGNGKFTDVIPKRITKLQEDSLNRISITTQLSL